MTTVDENVSQVTRSVLSRVWNFIAAGFICFDKFIKLRSKKQLKPHRKEFIALEMSVVLKS